MGFLPSLMLCALAVFSLLLLRAERLLRKPKALFISAALIALAFGLRAVSMSHITLDYENFLAHWVQHFRDSGGFAGIADYSGNYNIPYLYFLALFSYSSVSDLYLIKLLSIFFDIVLAWGVLRLVTHFKVSNACRLAAFLGTFLLPTVVLNGAYWGQCDSIYAAFSVWALYFVLSGHGVLSMVFMALSFSFKLQAIFFMPAFFVFLFTDRIKLRHLPIFPLTYLLIVLPAVALGKPFGETIMLYFNQAHSIGTGLNYNSPSIFAFLQSENTELLSKIGIAAAFLFIFLVYAALWRKRSMLSDKVLLIVSLLLVVGIPFLLPHMHDRYFFGADVLSFAAALVMWRLAPVPVLCSFASLNAYYAYLRMRYFLYMSWGAAALIIALLWLIVELIWHMHSPGRRIQN